MADDRPGYSFDPGPPPEASKYLANKGLKPAFSWRDVEPEEHAIAFSVAKATRLDVLTTIREEVQRALDQGVPFAEFQRSLRPRLEALGWWGKGSEVDPATGKRLTVQLGSPRRLKTIYEANIRSARAAGQWNRIQRTKRAMPYLLYQLGPSVEHRPEHAARNGVVLPADDPFWSTWYPPNGWGCKCWVRQLTRRAAEDHGIDEAAPPDRMREVRNKRTGVVKQVPEGIDPGWERNPGRDRLATVEQLLDERLAAADPQTARTAVLDVARSWRAERVLRAEAPGSVPIGVLPQSVADAVGMRARVIRTTAEYGRKFEEKERSISIEELVGLADGLEHGPLMIERIGASRSLLVVTPGDRPWLFAVKLLPDAGEIGEIWLRTAHQLKRGKWSRLLSDPAVTVLRDVTPGWP